jgi:hypothetical protein
MDSAPPNQQGGSPEAETLKTRSETAAQATAAGGAPASTRSPSAKESRHRSYRPSHKATFIGLAVVVVILAINVLILELVLKKQAKNENLLTKGQVTISSADLSRLGIDRNAIGASAVQLTVAPDAQFKGKVTVAGGTVISGQLTLNSKLTGTDANLSQLQAGDTSLSKLNVNGDSTVSSLNLRKDLIVSGLSQLQGPVTLKQLLTVNSNATISGNLSVGGVLSVNTFSVQSLVVNGHLITSGPAPNVGPGGAALGSNGSVSISGNDAAGTVAINIGSGPNGNGLLANVAFRTQYSNVPRVVISPVGIGAGFYVSNISAAGFSIGITGNLPLGSSLRINYIVEQ